MIVGVGGGGVTSPQTRRGRVSFAPPAGDIGTLAQNRPAGFTTTIENDHTVLTPSGWGIASRESPDPVVVAGATPDIVGTSSFVRQSWENVTDGGSPNYLFHVMSGTSDMYFCQVMRMSPNWAWADIGSPTYGCKWTTFLSSSGSGWTGIGPWFDGGAPNTGAHLVNWTDQAGRSSRNWMTNDNPFQDGQYQDGDAGWQLIDTTDFPILNGEWFQKELICEWASGRVRMYINGVKTMDSFEQTGGEAWPFPAGYEISQLQLGSTLGGSANITDLSADYYADYAYTLVARDI